jgi:hypothetical protein
MQSGLVSAYRATDYTARGNGSLVVMRIGHHSLAADRLLARMHATSGAFITAWNPFGKALSTRVNQRWSCELKRDLGVRGVAFVDGEGRGITGEWPAEASLLAFGLSRREASAIGRRYRQNAVVYVPQGRPAELVMLRWVR